MGMQALRQVDSAAASTTLCVLRMASAAPDRNQASAGILVDGAAGEGGGAVQAAPVL